MKPSEFQDIITQEAAKVVAQIVPPEAEDKVRAAHLELEMLAAGFRSQDSAAATLRVLVARVAATRSWAQCKYVNPTRWPQRFTSHEDFIEEAALLAGCDRKDKGILKGIGNVAMFTADNNMDLETVLVGNYTNTRTGLPVLKAAVAKEDAEAVGQILKDVKALSPTEFRRKYTTPRHDAAGTARTGTARDGARVLVALVNNDNDMERVIRVLGGILKWELDAEIRDSGRDIVIRIEGAPSEVWSEAMERVTA